jgi:hypothetical protein
MSLNEVADCIFAKLGDIFYQFDTVLFKWVNLLFDELVNVGHVEDVWQVNPMI